jgi:dolichol kinase
VSLAFFIFQVAKFAVLFIIIIITGSIASQGRLKVNYTRKINHFAIAFLPELLYKVIYYEINDLTVVAGAVISLSYFALLIKPVRSRVRLLQTAFCAIDRPEDRPHTLFLFVTQFTAGIVVIVPFFLYFSYFQDFRLVYIPLFINGLGDGLAEPVGVRFGRHPYKVRPLFGNKTYIRTIEGSACVFIISIVILLLFKELFTARQLIAALILLPPAATAAEALSPHTWDAPFILAVCGLVLTAVKLIFS